MEISNFYATFGLSMIKVAKGFTLVVSDSSKKELLEEELLIIISVDDKFVTNFFRIFFAFPNYLEISLDNIYLI